MEIGKTEKIFGTGPIGLILSIALLPFFWWLNQILGHPSVLDRPAPLRYVSALLILTGGGLYLWSFITLRNWWMNDRLCTSGPFRWFRHPMYAAWITFIAPGIALFLNSWVLLLWVAILHPLWHILVMREEKMMRESFGKDYGEYAARTGRFFPRVLCRQ